MGKASENGEVPAVTNGERSSNPNITRITGKKENCEGASQALLELVPITAEVSVPYEFHRYIIGQKGVGVRDMMNKFDVNIRVPAQDANSDVILISGVPTNVDAAKLGLAEKVKELEAEKEVIKKLREDFDVQIQLPKKEAPNSEVITITGFEADANKAKEAILKIVGQFESMVQEEVSIDPRVHSMIIGKRGRSIRKIMEDFKVDIRLPREGDADPSRVVVSGDEDAVLDCIDHLKIIEEEFIQDAADNDWMRQYEKPTRQLANKDSNKDQKGFYVAKAPWDVSSSEAFPSLGGGGGSSASSKPPTWGPKRH